VRQPSRPRKYRLTRIRPLEDDGEPDIETYNAELKARGNPTWHNVQWLYSECYLYRRISSLFWRSKHWKNYDVFGRQKLSTFKSSRPAVLELAAKYSDIVKRISEDSAVIHSDDPAKIENAEKVLFMEMCEICLWGNATDLSLLTSLSYEDIQKLQGSNARKESEKNILVNDLPAAFDILKNAKNAGKKPRVSIVLDNAGFELFVDLILAGYLLAEELASEVVLHPKSIPWFVSDVVPKDFVDLLNVMADPQPFYAATSDSTDDSLPTPLTEEDVRNMKFLFDNWSYLHGEGKLILRPSRFWTHPGSFWRLPHTAPEVLDDLKGSELVIFKGDLNYRKLTGDVGALNHPHRLEVTNMWCRRLGILPLLLQKVSVRLERHPECVHWRCEHARLMLWSDCLQAEMKRSCRWKEVEGNQGQENGHGVGSGLLCSYVMERNNGGIVLRAYWSGIDISVQYARSFMKMQSGLLPL
jgi:damage-control phosphatase, subfamily III